MLGEVEGEEEGAGKEAKAKRENHHNRMTSLMVLQRGEEVKTAEV